MIDTDDEFDNGKWRIEHNSLEKKYYELREKVYYEMQRYYRQSPYGIYVDEDSLISNLNELKSIRKELQKYNVHTPIQPIDKDMFMSYAFGKELDYE